MSTKPNLLGISICVHTRQGLSKHGLNQHLDFINWDFIFKDWSKQDSIFTGFGFKIGFTVFCKSSLRNTREIIIFEKHTRNCVSVRFLV